jgi:hypothetical protein
MGSCATDKGQQKNPPRTKPNTQEQGGIDMNASTLAAAFSNALTAAPKSAPRSTTPQLATVTVTAPVIPTRTGLENRWRMNDDLLLSVLQQSLTPADQIMARRTLLKPAPWELL